MSEHLTTDEFKAKVFNWEENSEWKYEGELPAIVDFYDPHVGANRYGTNREARQA